MPQRRVAWVRFSEGGKPYPVNSKYHVNPDDFVVVRLEGKFTPLQKAQVVSEEYEDRVCRHSVVCFADDADAYGVGPDGVQTEAGLDRFLVGYAHLRKFPVLYAEAPHQVHQIPQPNLTPHSRWHAAYVSGPRLGKFGEDGRYTVDTVILWGRDEIVFQSWESGRTITIARGAMIEDNYLARGVPLRGEGMYPQVAKWAERDSTDDPPDFSDTSRADLRELFGEGGYMSDDVYL